MVKQNDISEPKKYVEKKFGKEKQKRNKRIGDIHVYKFDARRPLTFKHTSAAMANKRIKNY